MNATLVRAAIALVPGSLLLAGTLVMFLGAGCLVVVILTHFAEALRLFPAMQWGEPHSAGHYLDLTSAVTGVTLLAVGFVMRVRHGR